METKADSLDVSGAQLVRHLLISSFSIFGRDSAGVCHSDGRQVCGIWKFSECAEKPRLSAGFKKHVSFHCNLYPSVADAFSGFGFIA